MKIITAILMAFMALTTTAYASYTSILSEKLKSDDNIFFADMMKTENGECLITVSDNEDRLSIYMHNEKDGNESTGELEIVTGGNNIYRLSLVTNEQYDFVLLETNNIQEFYTFEEEHITKADVEQYMITSEIAVNQNGKTDTLGNTKDKVYDILKNMKYKQLENYSFKNCIDTIDKDELWAMWLYITCAADIMKYDSAAVDFDELMKYILNTHRNFIPLTPLSTGNYNDNTEIGIVKTDYIDHIVKEIFELEPQHPDIAQLTERGYCENNGYYNYKKVFNVYFVTAIDSIEAVYEIGNNVYYIVFGDTYTERGVSIREYSYMILKGKNKSYKILKIDMGGELPSEHEVIKYAGIDSEYKNDENNMYSGTGINKKIKIVFTAFLITTGGAVIWYKRRKL